VGISAIAQLLPLLDYVDMDGALLLAGQLDSPQLAKSLAAVAVMFATINVVGGFLVTHRMLAMFRKKK